MAVLGGGIGGLTATHELAERGFSVVVYEARAEAGGKSRSCSRGWMSPTGTRRSTASRDGEDRDLSRFTGMIVQVRHPRTRARAAVARAAD